MEASQPNSENIEAPLFGTVERRLFRATAVLFSLVAFALLVGGVVWIVGMALSFFSNIIVLLAVAGILALVLDPLVSNLELRMGLPRVAATSFVVLAVMAIIGSVVWALAPTVSREVSQFMEIAPGVLSGWQDYLSGRFPNLTQAVMESGKDGQLNELVPDMETSGKTIRAYAGLIIHLSFVPLLLFFALLSGRRLRQHAKDILSIFSSRTQHTLLNCIDIFVRQVTGFFQGQLVIAMIMGALLAAGFSLIGLKGGIVIGMLLGLLNVVPFLGMLVGLMVVFPIAYFQTDGGFQLVLLSLLVFVLIQIVESWLLTPKIMANRSGLHPALVVISVLFWGIALGGVTGMVLAVPLTAFLVAIWSQVKASLTRSMRSEEDAIRIVTPSGNRAPEHESPAASPIVRKETDGRLPLT